MCEIQSNEFAIPSRSVRQATRTVTGNEPQLWQDVHCVTSKQTGAPSDLVMSTPRHGRVLGAFPQSTYSSCTRRTPSSVLMTRSEELGTGDDVSVNKTLCTNNTINHPDKVHENQQRNEGPANQTVCAHPRRWRCDLIRQRE